MPRKSASAYARSINTNNERKMNCVSGDYGTQDMRLGKDSIKDFDCCGLTLQPCKQPVLTPHGCLFDKEAILEYILTQKLKNIKMKKRINEEEKKMKEEEMNAMNEEKQKKVLDFIKNESDILNPGIYKEENDRIKNKSSSILNYENGKFVRQSSFWSPDYEYQKGKSLPEKISNKIICPLCGRLLKAQELIDVKFTKFQSEDKSRVASCENRYICPITGDFLSNFIPCAVLKTSGSVVTMDSVEKVIKKDMIDPTNGVKLQSERDIIALKRGGTGFVHSSSSNLKASIKNPVLGF